MKISPTTYEQAKTLATQWQGEIEISREQTEIKFHEIMQQMLKDPMNKVFLIELLDQSFRSNDNSRVADQLEYLFDKYGNTDIFTTFEKLLVWAFRHVGIYLPAISIPLFIQYLRNDISNVVIKGESSLLAKHLQFRKSEQTRVNINIIGESVLGEEEAKERVQKYISALKSPDIDYISIKISTIFSQITPIAHQWSLDQISQRLEMIYTAAMEHPYLDAEGNSQYKFVNLDMEEYRDLPLTVDVFMQTLSKDAFKDLHAGIVLQAYLPDALEYLVKLADWAKIRVKQGGAPIKVRLVKGANQEMELTEASLRDWPCVTYLDKAETDANYKILMDYLLSADVAPCVHTGVASHNLFDHALGVILAEERNVKEYYTAEMLEGMSEAAYKVLKKEGLNVILYAPTATLDTFTNAIAYLVRRFDENTAEQNFLRHSFGLTVGSQSWQRLVKSYDDALEILPNTRLKPFRTQDRNVAPVKSDATDSYQFKNISDTDFFLTPNHQWAETIREKWKNIGVNGGFNATPVIGGKAIGSCDPIEVIDKSQYHEGVIVGTYVPASEKELDEAVRVATCDPDGWRKLEHKARQKILMDVAFEFEKNRADLIGVAAAEMGKVFNETDVEVSEAIDFLNFYPYSIEKMASIEGLAMQGKGVGLVVSPWNFPIAIPAGGIAAALASGNTVILKPSSDAILCGYRLCQCFWDAGVSKNALQFVPTSGALAGKMLVPNPAIDFVIFTGSESTAYQMIKSRCDIHLSAETGGKDATIVTVLADRDQAVKNVVASAFNNSGQKCSATSLLVLEKELYEDESFKHMLIDAAASLQVGSVWDFQNRIGALVHPPRDNLKKALATLSEDETWALEPHYADADNPYMLKPSIRWGTKEGDFCHMNELFGPVLSVMCADNLEDAIHKVNATGYGLTSGLESLDEREQDIWKEKLLAGNLYINRMTTGAIVLRQPFGGMRKSAIGSGKKAGGLNYVSQFMQLSFVGTHKEETSSHSYIETLQSLLKDSGTSAAILNDTIETASNFAFWLQKEFLQEHDYCNIRGESNVIRYLPVNDVLLRCEEADSLYEILSSITAAKMSGASLRLSIPTQPKNEALLYLKDNRMILLNETDLFVQEDEAALIEAMRTADRIRFLKPANVSKSIYNALEDEAVYISSEPFVGHGRIEMMHYFREQSISNSYHRYGNLGLKGLKAKETK